ncbi:heavy-metal resistance [Methylobacterium mesophilicum]
MAAPADSPNPFDPLGLAASMDEWCCLLRAARELRDIDAEMMGTMMEADFSGPANLSPEALAKVRSVARLMRSLNLDPEAIRQREPEAMRAIEAACLSCAERSRCTRELWAGTAADAYREYCPNAVRLDGLRRA